MCYFVSRTTILIDLPKLIFLKKCLVLENIFDFWHLTTMSRRMTFNLAQTDLHIFTQNAIRETTNLTFIQIMYCFAVKSVQHSSTWYSAALDNFSIVNKDKRPYETYFLSAEQAAIPTQTIILTNTEFSRLRYYCSKTFVYNLFLIKKKEYSFYRKPSSKRSLRFFYKLNPNQRHFPVLQDHALRKITFLVDRNWTSNPAQVFLTI